MSELKQMRGQVRIVVKELLPEILKEVLAGELKKSIDARLDAVDKHLKTTLEDIEKRHKDIMAYLLRESNVFKKKS
jgi:hypothetical protein